MKYILVLLVLFSSLNADKMKVKSLACPTILQLQKAPLLNEADSLDLSMYTIANSCVVLSLKDKIKAIGYDPRNSKDIYQKIIYEKTDNVLYILRSSIVIEQGGKKGSMRF